MIVHTGMVANTIPALPEVVNSSPNVRQIGKPEKYAMPSRFTFNRSLMGRRVLRRVLAENATSPNNIINHLRKLKVNGSVSGNANRVTAMPTPPSPDAILAKNNPQNRDLLKSFIIKI